MRVLKRALKLHPQNPILLTVLNRAYFEHQNYKDALDGVMQILKQNQKNTAAWDLIHKIYISAKNLDHQIDNFPEKFGR